MVSLVAQFFQSIRPCFQCDTPAPNDQRCRIGASPHPCSEFPIGVGAPWTPSQCVVHRPQFPAPIFGGFLLPFRRRAGGSHDLVNEPFYCSHGKQCSALYSLSWILARNPERRISRIAVKIKRRIIVMGELGYCIHQGLLLEWHVDDMCSPIHDAGRQGRRPIPGKCTRRPNRSAAHFWRIRNENRNLICVHCALNLKRHPIGVESCCLAYY